MTDDEIVKSVSGLSHFEVHTLSWRICWDGVAIDTMQLFLFGCHCDFESRQDMKRIEDYLDKDPTFSYLRRDPDWKIRWMPMLVAWRHNIAWALATGHAPPSILKLAQRLTPLLKQKPV